MFKPGDAVRPGRGEQPRVLTPEEIIAANPLARYPDGYSASYASDALANGELGYAAGMNGPRIARGLLYNERPDGSEDLGDPPTGPPPPGFPLPDPTWEEPVTETLGRKLRRLTGTTIFSSLPPGSYTKQVLFQNRAWKSKVETLFARYGPPTDEENQGLLDCRDMPHKWLRSYIARVKKELEEAVKVLRAAYFASPGDQAGPAAVEERRYLRGALDRAEAALHGWEHDVLRVTIVGWTKYLENDIGHAPDNR